MIPLRGQALAIGASSQSTFDKGTDGENPGAEYQAKKQTLGSPSETRFRATPAIFGAPHDQLIYERGAPIHYAYFPVGAVLSALTVMEDGNAIEVATIGNEGVVGNVIGSGDGISPNRIICQIQNGVLRIATEILRKEMLRDGPVSRLLIAYHTAFLVQVSQSVACNGLHQLEQRCCRWLLMTRDRVGSDNVKLTHEYLAFMIGARRASVTEVLRPLQEAGIIRSHRGSINILNRKQLEARACECYRAVRDEYARLLGPDKP